ncbi:hypothetical protein [Cytobacillus stercorigallinarum]|uniref:hypothetical protein n=1 Tax=Cytobacillus stercorigallinarum TaxID=2762240 RepID=UPI001CD86083|nr:hypothetical protein [Cytobacillus stercorigallinarum]
MMLKEEQYILLREYCSVLNTLEESFTYIVDSFTDLDKDDGDELLFEVIDSFPQIKAVNEQLLHLFKENSEMVHIMHVFEKVQEQADRLEQTIGNAPEKQEILREQFFPLFAAWHRMIDYELQPYLIS